MDICQLSGHNFMWFYPRPSMKTTFELKVPTIWILGIRFEVNVTLVEESGGGCVKSREVDDRICKLI